MREISRIDSGGTAMWYAREMFTVDRAMYIINRNTIL